MPLLDIRIKPRRTASLADQKVVVQPTWRPSDIEETAGDPLPPPPPKRKRAAKEFRIGRSKVAATAGMGRKTKSRFVMQPLSGRIAKMPAYDNPAIVEGRTMYPSTVHEPGWGGHPVLKSGFNQAKIGGEIVKGKWKGMPVYVLTLEERATCPEDCSLFRACYGNNSHLSVRYKHGPALESALRREVAALAREHRRGFVVRLHQLGDFYSVEYVDLWRELLTRHKELHVFGYSARWGRDPISQALLKLAYESWDRFAIRFSNAPIETASTITIDHPGQKPVDAVICPAQLGQVESCSVCALCWNYDRRIAFIRH